MMIVRPDECDLLCGTLVYISRVLIAETVSSR